MKTNDVAFVVVAVFFPDCFFGCRPIWIVHDIDAAGGFRQQSFNRCVIGFGTNCRDLLCRCDWPLVRREAGSIARHARFGCRKPQSLTNSRQSQRPPPSRFLLAQESRRPVSWLIDVVTGIPHTVIVDTAGRIAAVTNPALLTTGALEVC